MAVSAESLTELIVEAQKAFDDIKAELDSLADRVLELNEQRDAIAVERDAFVSSLERRYPNAQVPDVAPSKAGNMLHFVEIPDDDWSPYNRSEVVLRAVEELTEKKGFATPAEIEDLLKSKNRSDSRDAIGAALAYLNRSSKVHSIGRAQWAYGARP